ncbi:Beta-1,2-xylosyltransferase 1 [Lasiodiplodia theobromae]|uniref:Beta-1,2-xylosyltransferase 1 n=1 Tax=Lasiodiplodia theobromae TaxID=45133 RepID=A0A5N5D9F3_9PEZI|nr:Beta-1,2-xylosyltransferase 1 [Lasiodiplodia theobromae]
MLLIHWGQLELEFHQVDTLIHNAKRRHDAWLQTASSSTSLTEATHNYVARYNQTPPPHFDVWYEYATNRSSLIIDEFDTIYEDLLPFWSLSPAEIRKRTKESLNSPTGGVGGINIRGGVASISGNTPGTHKWELNGIIDIIDKFGKYLPDMDLAFNLNDECRVSIPYHELEKSRTAARQESAARKDGLGSLSNGFSEGRAEGWEVVPSEPLDLQRFIVLSFQNTWDFSSAHCPPDSAARLNRHLDPNTFCASCAAPHSLDVFLSNWTLAGDVCHQPDLAQLHGFYISPSAMDATPQLMPIFSQSKAGGFNDIRYPSPWNYMDKTRYDPNEEFPDPEFEAKQNAIFWRGATSEGFSKSGTGAWRGMSRQRFVGLFSNPSAAQALLLPDPEQRVDDDTARLRLRYALVDPSHLRDSIATDTHFTDVVRCDPPDCDDQIAQFGGLGDRTDFQAHWRYRYLLDIDGAGFSGRFLPFLQSRSLPFKTALFREWWETRIAEWVHFVPLDLRAHGAWATLAYFAGFEGSVEGETVSWPPHYLQAKALADEGALWARKVLRKEDMEIYMFRLLLEWGRLTDDRRADIGFTGRTS